MQHLLPLNDQKGSPYVGNNAAYSLDVGLQSPSDVDSERMSSLNNMVSSMMSSIAEASTVEATEADVDATLHILRRL